MLKMSKTKVAQIESVSNNLIPEFKEELDKERLTFSAAYELSGMTKEEQKKALSTLEENGKLSHKDVKTLKQGETKGDEPEKGENLMQSAAVGEYEPPHPKGITSICYSCTEYEICNVKTGTCTSCDQYKDRSEAYKTEEQQYSEEQDKIDQETKKKLREMAETEKMGHIPGESGGNTEKVHKIKLAAMYFDDVSSGKKGFELRKNDRGYKVGDILEMTEFKGGKETGRSIRAAVTYLLEDYTGIEDGYCIMGIKVIEKKEK
jgi:ParB family chromosome partitioning protein